MESNTPATQSFSSSNPDEDKPMRDSPIQDTAGPPESSKSAPASAPGTAPAPVRPKGANAGVVVLGLVALVLAAGIIATETMSVRVDWVALGPGAIVGVGVLLVVLGAVGLARRRGES